MLKEKLILDPNETILEKMDNMPYLNIHIRAYILTYIILLYSWIRKRLLTFMFNKNKIQIYQ